MIGKKTNLFSFLLLLNLASNASQIDFSLIKNARKYPLTDADFIVLTLAIREKYGVGQRSCFEKQPEELFKSNATESHSKEPLLPKPLFYPLKSNITDKFYKPRIKPEQK